jgi:antitoxin component YwqK of YwqJK toxin-antitoxin module
MKAQREVGRHRIKIAEEIFKCFGKPAKCDNFALSHLSPSMKTFLIIFFVLLSLNGLIAQTAINQTDANHLKQGKWIGKYPDGMVRYEGSFVNDKPSGEWKRYHENGKLKAILTYLPNSEKVKAELFDPEGAMISKGNFIGTRKDSIWTYYDNNVIVARESYSKGLKNGTCYTYYPDGKICVENNWTEGKLNGSWREYYSSGTIKSETRYFDGKRQGDSRIYFESGEIQIEGMYDNDQCSGTWKFYNPGGKVIFQMKYEAGVLLNPETLDSLQLNEFKALDNSKGKIKDPEHYRENPDEYLRK